MDIWDIKTEKKVTVKERPVANELPDVIYTVHENIDTTEGKGGMRMVPDSGFFLSEEEAWDFADTRGGIMCGAPFQDGKYVRQSWRNQTYPHVQVRKIARHDGEIITKKRELRAKKKELEREQKNIEQEIRKLNEELRS